MSNAAQAGDNPNKLNEEVVFNNCAPFTDCISEINNTQIDNAKDIDVLILMYNLIEYSDNYSKTSGSVWKYYRDEPSLNDAGSIWLFSEDTKTTTFAITDTKLCVPVVTLSTQDNAKLLEQLKSDFKRTVNWNKYQSKVTIQAPNPCLDFLIYPSFQGVNRAFVLSIENKEERTVHPKYYVPTVKIKDYKDY